MNVADDLAKGISANDVNGNNNNNNNNDLLATYPQSGSSFATLTTM